MEYILTRSTELLSNPLINIPQYLTKDILSHIILVIYLKIDLWEKFNLNSGYILIKVLKPDDQDNVLYKSFFTKLMNILQGNHFIIIENGDKLRGLVLGKLASGW